MLNQWLVSFAEDAIVATDVFFLNPSAPLQYTGRRSIYYAEALPNVSLSESHSHNDCFVNALLID